jgi:hypothetical protein
MSAMADRTKPLARYGAPFPPLAANDGAVAPVLMLVTEAIRLVLQQEPHHDLLRSGRQRAAPAHG